MFIRGKASFVSALAIILAVLCIIGGGAVVNCALGGGVAWAQLGEWLDGGSYLYPADLSGAENIITGATTEASADIRLNADGSAIFNEQGNDSDFRIEGDGDSNLLFVDAGNDRVYIGNNGGYTKLYVYEGGTPALPATTCQFMMQNSGSTNAPAGIEIVSGSQSTSHILMGDEAAPGASMIMHDNNTDDLTVTATGGIELDGDDVILGGDNVYVDGGLKVNYARVADADYSVGATVHFVTYSSLTANRTVTLPTTVAADAGRIILIGVEARTGGTLTIAAQPGGSVAGNSTISSADHRHVVCTGADTWAAN